MATRKTKKPSPYPKVPKEKLELRDYLAIDRTSLSTDRTMLAYVHAALGLLALGASAIGFFDSMLAQIAGWSLVVAAIGTLVLGVYRVRTMLGRIRDAVGPELPTPPEPPKDTKK